jgi:hypothetical protein
MEIPETTRNKTHPRVEYNFDCRNMPNISTHALPSIFHTRRQTDAISPNLTTFPETIALTKIFWQASGQVTGGFCQLFATAVSASGW